MIASIIYFVLAALISMDCVIDGLKQYKSKTPVSITWNDPPREEELTSVIEWNHRHGRDFIIFGSVLFVTLIVYIILLEKYDISTIHKIAFFIAIFGEIAWVAIEDYVMKKKMINKNSDIAE